MDCLERLFDSINAMDLTLLPSISRDEKRIMRVADRKDIFLEKFSTQREAMPSYFGEKAPSHPSADDSDSEAAFSTRSRTLSTTSSSSSVSQRGLKRPEFSEAYVKVTSDARSKAHSRLDKNKKTAGSGTHTSSDESARNIPAVKDTHFYDTSITYKHLTLPIRVPLYTFDEEVGEVCFC